MNPPVQDNRRRASAVLAVLWILVLSIIVLVDHQHWRRLAPLSQTAVPESQVTALQVRVGVIEQQLAVKKDQPIPVSADRFDVHSHAVDERLIHMEQRIKELVPHDALDALTGRVDALEIAKAHKLDSSNAATQPKKVQNLAEPPFRLLGLESRGGEIFLTISPSQAVSLAEMSVLRVGDVEGGWELDSLDSKSATFRYQGQLHRLQLP